MKPINVKRSERFRWLGYGICALSLSTSPMMTSAQDNEEALEEIIITGSRIARDPESYIGGMSILSGEQIENVGTYSTTDMLLRMPSIGSQATHRNNANGGRGAHFTEIHQLESERTLVLMNGRRMVSTIRDNLGLAVDLQSFPVNMIDRVEVLADGASSIYGSDAVAGVVNVMTKKNFEGVEVSGGYGLPTEDGGESWNAGILFGLQGNRGHVLAGATITDTGNVDSQERPWSRVPILGQFRTGGGQLRSLMGSGIPPEGRINSLGASVARAGDTNGDGVVNSSDNPLVPGRDLIFKTDPTSGASFQNYDTFGTSGLNGSAGDGSIQSILDTGHRFNYNDIPGRGSSLVNPSRVFNGAIAGEYQLDSGVTAYAELLALHREGTLNFTPLPVQGAAGRFTDLIQVPLTNPNIPADALAAIVAHQTAVAAADGTPLPTAFQMSYRGLDLGQRIFDYDSDTIKGTIGFTNDLELAGRNWTWDAFGTWGRSQLNEITFGQLNVANLQAAVDPAQCALISSCPKTAGGQPTLNIFGRGPKTQEEIDFVTFDDHDTTEYEMWHLGVSIGTNELFSMPAGDVGFATGFEWRDESGSSTPSGVVQAGDSGGNFAEPTDGSYKVWEAYAEVSVPLLQGAPFAEEVVAEAAVRHSDYDNASETTWKVGGYWTPHSLVSFRGQVSTGFRAPNILELFGGKVDNFIGVTDPCNATNTATNAVAAANCAAQGVPAGFVQPAAQLKVSQGGNPNLQPETSDHFSVGIVLTPEFIPDLSVAIDYYNVEVQGAVTTPTPDTVINDCYNTPNLAAPECDRIGRGPDGSVVRFDLLLENLSAIKTDGVDFNASYALDTNFGTLRFGFLGNWLHEYTKIEIDGTEDNRTDNIACDVCDFVAYPRWKTSLDAVWTRNNWTAGITWRRIDDMEVDDQIGVDTENTTVPAVDYLDLHASYNWKGHRFLLGIDNVTDEEPPFVPSISANTAPVYDYLGRFVYLRGNLRF